MPLVNPVIVVARALVMSVSAVALLLVVSLSTTDSAHAQIGCGGNPILVSTGAELNAAITCYNEVGDVTIELVNDIEADTFAGDAVFTAVDSGGEITIDGGGFTIRRGEGAGTARGALFALTDESPIPGLTELLIKDLAFELGPYDTVGVLQVGNDQLRMVSVSITAAIDSTATGVVAAGPSGQVSMSGSRIDGVSTGLSIATPTYYIDRSSITSSNVDIALNSPDGAGGIADSTLAGPVGLELTQGLVEVRNSSILGDGATSGSSSDSQGAVTYVSSIVNICSADQLASTAEPGPGFVDLGNNAGSCFPFEPPVLYQGLNDYGCVRATPTGCPLTARIGSASSARNVGLCFGFMTGNDSRDLRGQLRTPPASGCDAGSYEYGCERLGTSVFQVFTEFDFSAAVDCLNTAFDPFERVRIELNQNIAAETVGPISVFEPVTGPLPGTLVINGNGYTLRRSSAGPADAVALLAVDEATAIDLEVRDVVIEVGPADTHGIRALGQGGVDLDRSVITASAPVTATGVLVRSDPALGRLASSAISDSIIENMRIGVEAQQNSMRVYGTTMTSSEADVVNLGSDLLAIVNSTLTAPTGLRLAADSGTSVIGWSTMLGNGADLVSDSTGTVSAVSSIVGACSSSITDDGGNTGVCFDPGAVIDTTLADNGCEAVTPVGCPQTIALGAESPARFAGDCSETDGGLVDVDQRGRSRTPVGPGCDSGAFEAECVPQAVAQVATVKALNNEIRCFNTAISDPGGYSISLTEDLVVSPLTDDDDRTVAIDQRLPGFELTIEGNNYAMSETEAPADLISLGLIRIAETNQSSLIVRNLTLDASWQLGFPSPGLLFDNQSSADVTIDASSITHIGAAAFRSTGGGSLTISDSSVRAAYEPFVISGGTFTARNSTFENFQSPGFSAIVLGREPFVIANSTFAGSGLASNNGAGGTIRNSTLQGFGIAGSSPMLAQSSIVNECNGGGVIDGGSNVGGCFGISTPFGELVDNGCLVPTPVGCPKTFALSADSPAIGAGDCTSVPTDQRGVSRTPAGPGCDAGAYEIEDLLGDVDDNGVVDNADVQALLVWLAGGVEPASVASGELTGDDVVKLEDALALAKLVAGG